jgi:hypothetical protein
MKEDSSDAFSIDGRILEYAWNERSDGVASARTKVNGRFLMILQRSIGTTWTRAQMDTAFRRDANGTRKYCFQLFSIWMLTRKSGQVD